MSPDEHQSPPLSKRAAASGLSWPTCPVVAFIPALAIQDSVVSKALVRLETTGSARQNTCIWTPCSEMLNQQVKL